MATLPTTRAHEEIISFIASEIDPRHLIDFKPSEQVKGYIADLVFREKTSGLSGEEQAELDYFMQLEHIMRLAKARARQRMGNE